MKINQFEFVMKVDTKMENYIFNTDAFHLKLMYFSNSINLWHTQSCIQNICFRSFIIMVWELRMLLFHQNNEKVFLAQKCLTIESMSIFCTVCVYDSQHLGWDSFSAGYCIHVEWHGPDQTAEVFRKLRLFYTSPPLVALESHIFPLTIHDKFSVRFRQGSVIWPQFYIAIYFNLNHVW